MRINKYLATCGLGSRRKCEDLVTAGRVAVNGKKIFDLAVQIDEQNDQITIDSKPVKFVDDKEYYLVNKPRGYTSTVSDPHAQKKVTDLVTSGARLFPVGRLDRESEGLIILTNDGDFAQKMVHPSFSHEKQYFVEVQGPNSQMEESLSQALKFFTCGIKIDNIRTRPAKAKVISKSGNKAIFDIILTEGRKRQIRRTMDRAKLTVTTLKRTRIADYELGDIEVGANKKFRPNPKTLDIEG